MVEEIISVAILQNNPTVERIETDGITSAREFVFGDNEDIFVPVKPGIIVLLRHRIQLQIAAQILVVLIVIVLVTIDNQLQITVVLQLVPAF